MVTWIKKMRFYQQSGFLYLRYTFRPLYVLLSVLGLLPYSVKCQTISDHRFSIIRKSIYFNSICAFAYVTVILFFLVMHIRYIYFSIEVSALTEGIMTQLNYITELFSLTIFCVVTYVCTFLNRFKYVKILNVLASCIDPPNNNSEKVLRNLRFQINVVAMGSITLTFLMQMCVNFTRRDSPWKMFLVVFSFNLPQMIQFTCIAFFYVLMRMAVEILKNIREQTSVLAKEKKIYMDGLTKVDSKQRVLTLRQMELIYMEISNVTQTVNHVFEAPILVTMMQCFHSIVSESHIIYHGIVIEDKLQLHDITNCSVWIVYQFMKVYAVASAGNLFKVEAIRLGRAIHYIPTERQDLRFMMEIAGFEGNYFRIPDLKLMKVHNAGLETDAGVECRFCFQTSSSLFRVVTKVQHFSSIMSFQTNELTIYGYFPLDATLTFKVVAAAAMYVIILVQFDKAK